MEETPSRNGRRADERSLLGVAGVLTNEEARAIREAIRERESESRHRLDRLTDEMRS